VHVVSGSLEVDRTSHCCPSVLLCLCSCAPTPSVGLSLSLRTAARQRERCSLGIAWKEQSTGELRARSRARSSVAIWIVRSAVFRNSRVYVCAGLCRSAGRGSFRSTIVSMRVRGTYRDIINRKIHPRTTCSRGRRHFIKFSCSRIFTWGCRMRKDARICLAWYDSIAQDTLRNGLFRRNYAHLHVSVHRECSRARRSGCFESRVPAMASPCWLQTEVKAWLSSWFSCSFVLGFVSVETKILPCASLREILILRSIREFPSQLPLCFSTVIGVHHLSPARDTDGNAHCREWKSGRTLALQFLFYYVNASGNVVSYARHKKSKQLKNHAS